MNYELLKSLLFRLDAEQAHHLAMRYLCAVQSSPALLRRMTRTHTVDDPRLRTRVFGVDFPNPVGLAAGFDKDAVAVRAFAALGFGSVEIGTVTPKPQAGNPRPRLFRHPEARSLQNAMGFNNQGFEAVHSRLSGLGHHPVPLGINVGKNKTTSPEQTLDDYRLLIEGFHTLADYLVVNVSSPNTPGLRDFQNEGFIRELFEVAVGLTKKPVLLKVAPDLDVEALVRLCHVAVDAGAAGIIANNTSIDYSLVPGAKDFGGLSGAAIRDLSFRVLQAIAAELYGKTTLISVGGIDSGEEAIRRLRAGASLVQVYTGFIYNGPGVVREINRAIVAHLHEVGAAGVGDIVGADRLS